MIGLFLNCHGFYTMAVLPLVFFFLFLVVFSVLCLLGRCFSFVSFFRCVFRFNNISFSLFFYFGSFFYSPFFFSFFFRTYVFLRLHIPPFARDLSNVFFDVSFPTERNYFPPLLHVTLHSWLAGMSSFNNSPAVVDDDQPRRAK